MSREYPDYTHLGSKHAATKQLRKLQGNLPKNQQGYWFTTKDGRRQLIGWEGVRPRVFKSTDVTDERLYQQQKASIDKPKSRYRSQAPKSGVRRARVRGQDGKVYSSLEQKELAYKKIAEIKAYNKANNLKSGDPGFRRVEHRIQIANDDFWNSPKGKSVGRPNDGWNLTWTNDEIHKIKDPLEQKIKGFPYIVDVDEVTGEPRVVSFDDFDPNLKAGAQGTLIEAGSDLDEITFGLKTEVFKNEAVTAW